MAMSYVVCGWVKQRVCGRCANVEMPEKPHYIHKSMFRVAATAQNSHQFPISSLAHPIVLVRMAPGCERGANVIARELGQPAMLSYAIT